MVLIFAGAAILGYLLYCVFVSAFPGRIDIEEISPSDRKQEMAILLLSPGNHRIPLQKRFVPTGYKREAGAGGVRWWNMPVKALQLKRNIKRMDGNVCIRTGENLYNKLSEALGKTSGCTVPTCLGLPLLKRRWRIF